MGEKQYLDLNGEQLIKDELYFVELRNIYGIQLQPERVVDYESDLNGELKECGSSVYDLCSFQHSLFERDVFTEDFDFTNNEGEYLVLLRYLGDNQFLEFSSKSIIRYQDYSKKYVSYKYAFNFMKRYRELVENPLFIKKGSLLGATNKARKEFYYLREHGALKCTQTYLCNAKNTCVTSMNDKLSEIMLQDEKFAYLENDLWDFAHSKLKN